MQPETAISPMRFFSRPGPQAGQRSGADQPVGGLVCAASLGFGGVGTREQECGLWPHADKTRGFQRGAWSPLWHTTLLARCSVLYLLARLTGKAGCDAVCTPLALAGKWAVVLWSGGSKTIVHFQ